MSNNLQDLKARQAVAAERYEDALRELYESYIALGALDHAIAHGGVADLRTFGQNLDEHRAALHAHPLVSDPDPTPLSSRTAEAMVAVLNGD